MDKNEGEEQIAQEQEVEQIESEVETLEEQTEEEKDTTDWKSKYEETQSRLKRAETKLEKSKIEKKADAIAEERIAKKTGELDETQLDYLDLKGYTDEEEIEVVQKVMLKTGQTVRQALKDDYVQSKITALRKNKADNVATPTGARRGGQSTSNLNTYIAEYERSGKLPDDFEMRTKIVNTILDRSSMSKPSWQK